MQETTVVFVLSAFPDIQQEVFAAMIQVSVVIPLYNIDETYFRACMESLLNQTLREIEIIVVDDGSTTNIGAVADEYAARYANVTVIHQQNAGVSVARNTGIEHAKGTWIWFVDPDDWVETDTLRWLLAQPNTQTDDIVSFGYQTEFPDHRTMPSEPPRDPWHGESEQEKSVLIRGILNESNRLLPCWFGSACIQLYRKTFLDAFHLRFIPHMKKSEDAVFLLYATWHASSITDYYQPFYHYRKHQTSVCNRYNPHMLPLSEKVIEETQRFLKQTGADYEIDHHCLVMKLYINVMRLSVLHPDCADTKREKKRQWKQLVGEPSIFGRYLRAVSVRRLWTQRKYYAVVVALTRLGQFALLGKFMEQYDRKKGYSW